MPSDPDLLDMQLSYLEIIIFMLIWKRTDA